MIISLREAAPAVGVPCPVCRKETSRSFRSRPEGDAALGAIFLACGGCGLRFQQTRMHEDGSIFAQVEHPREAEEKREKATARSRMPFSAVDQDVLSAIERLTPGRRLLDVGSGDGRFLAAARKRGFHGEGVDISSQMAELASAASGTIVRAGWLPDLGLPAAGYDVINVDLVLMYVPEPLPLMRECARLLAPGGICRVREFFCSSVNAALRGAEWWMYADTRLRAYSHRAFRRLAGNAGLRPVRCIPGAEMTYATWSSRGGAAPTGALPRLRSWAGYRGRKLAFGSYTVAADCTYYLRKGARG